MFIAFLSSLNCIRSDLGDEKQGSIHSEDGLGQRWPLPDEVIYSNDSCVPVQNDNFKSCACMLERTKSYVNLNGILNNNCSYAPGGCKIPRFTIPGDDKWDYAYHPCVPFSMFQNASHFHAGDKACKGVAAARYTTESALICGSLGSQNSFKFKLQAKSKLIVSNLALVLEDTKTRSSAFISLICNSSIPANESVFNFHGSDYHIAPTYYLSVESICCCPGGCNVTFPIYNKENDDPTKGFLTMIGIIAGVIVIMIVVFVFVKCTKLGKANDERQRLLDPVT